MIAFDCKISSRGQQQLNNDYKHKLQIWKVIGCVQIINFLVMQNTKVTILRVQFKSNSNARPLLF